MRAAVLTCGRRCSHPRHRAGVRTSGSEASSFPRAGTGRKGDSAHHRNRGNRPLIVAVVSPAGAKVAAKDVFELAKWVPAEQAEPVLLGAGFEPDPGADRSAVSEARSSGLRLVNDPSREAWNYPHWLGWLQWTMQKAGVRGAGPLGSTLTAASCSERSQRTRWFGSTCLRLPS